MLHLWPFPHEDWQLPLAPATISDTPFEYAGCVMHHQAPASQADTVWIVLNKSNSCAQRTGCYAQDTVVRGQKSEEDMPTGDVHTADTTDC